MANHKWGQSRVGHGEQQCEYCFITNREAAVLDEWKCPNAQMTPTSRSVSAQPPTAEVDLVRRLFAEARTINDGLSAITYHIESLRAEIDELAVENKDVVHRHVELLHEIAGLRAEIATLRKPADDEGLVDLLARAYYDSRNFTKTVDVWDKENPLVPSWSMIKEHEGESCISVQISKVLVAAISPHLRAIASQARRAALEEAGRYIEQQHSCTEITGYQAAATARELTEKEPTP